MVFQIEHLEIELDMFDLEEVYLPEVHQAEAQYKVKYLIYQWLYLYLDQGLIYYFVILFLACKQYNLKL
jgi:hypothetical protein